MDPNVEPWIYPMYYPHGTPGWHDNIKQINGKRLRVEKHQGLIDYLEKKATDANARVGRIMILPSTFIGSPRNMMQNYQDAMAIKRGLPHVHILVTLKQQCKIINSETVDKYISAEIPDPAIDQNLHEIVMKNMIHGPCGNWCMVNGKCSKHFPKSFHEETTMDENGYPQYRRRDTSILYEKPGGFVVDNRFVVPYCPILSTIFNCHINVEVVSSIKSVKYLYKYIYKGHDAASVVIEEDVNNMEIVHDEIKDFIEARYVGPVEAYWRIVNKILQEKSHAIIRLPVHLPSEQNVIISDHLNEQDLQSALERITMLMDYFELNKRDVDAHQYVYTDIPLYYVFKKVILDGKQISRWEKHQSKFNCIGRMYSVSPTEIELFHLRILLLNIKGATSYNALKTVNGVLHQTFTSACLALGLIEDDDEWKRAISEASIYMDDAKTT
ncbi:uncharacterized protein LOC114943179 [Nylanderia fulva]|uniref:uncharacterized protein LOC114943179 n=1 Tax=Nylanderia fulva TaxID=613905 RepID=UPI0010FAE178|nr:uncharacterized protein LOC114943179 [Nylanderia fulva]